MTNIFKAVCCRSAEGQGILYQGLKASNHASSLHFEDQLTNTILLECKLYLQDHREVYKNRKSGHYTED